MSVLHVKYDMEVRYAKPVVRSFFTIKCTPVNDQRQKLLSMYTEMTPEVSCNIGKDSFGNKQIYGGVFAPHDTFLFHMTGKVETEDSCEVGTSSALQCGIYRYPHGKCVPWAGAEERRASSSMSKLCSNKKLDRKNKLGGSVSDDQNSDLGPASHR